MSKSKWPGIINRLRLPPGKDVEPGLISRMRKVQHKGWLARRFGGKLGIRRIAAAARMSRGEVVSVLWGHGTPGARRLLLGGPAPRSWPPAPFERGSRRERRRARKQARKRSN